jgi:hypothetical protein
MLNERWYISVNGQTSGREIVLERYANRNEMENLLRASTKCQTLNGDAYLEAMKYGVSSHRRT